MNFYTLAIGDPNGVWRMWDGVRKWDRAGQFYPLALRTYGSPELYLMFQRAMTAVVVLARAGRGQGELKVVPIPFAGMPHD